jgi:hypothetical protein
MTISGPEPEPRAIISLSAPPSMLCSVARDTPTSGLSITGEEYAHGC